MLQNEFEKLAGYKVTEEEYRNVETCYEAGDLDKQDFVKDWNEHNLKESAVFNDVFDSWMKAEGKANQMEKMSEELAKRGLKWVDGELVEVPSYERIRTVEDALRALGTPDELVKEFFKDAERWGKDVVAFLKLRVIVEAINEGWKPKFVKGEYRYFPWFWLYKDRAAAIDDGNKEEDIFDIPAVVGGAHYGGDIGVSVLYSNRVASSAYTYFGGALALRDRERAIYCGKQFIAEWMEYLVVR